MHRGYVKRHRKVFDWQWYTDVPTCRLFDHLVLKANIKSKPWLNITINRGELVTSLGSLSIETGLSVRQIRTALDKLKNTKDVTIKNGNKYSIITICNYEIYNSDDKQMTGKRQADDKPATTTKEWKEDKKIRKEEEVIILPGYILKKDWEDFLTMRLKIKKPLTGEAIKRMLNKLETFHKQGHDIHEILDNSITNDYAGVFVPNKTFKPQQRPNMRKPITTRQRTEELDKQMGIMK